MTGLTLYTAIATAVSSALVGGILFAFSTFIMRALAQQSPASGIRTMQAINATVFTPFVMVPYIGTAPVLLALAGFLWAGDGAAAESQGITAAQKALVSTAAVAYFVGCLVITRARNVPMNEHLDTLEPESEEAQRYWQTYLSTWTQWNHLRTASCVLTSVGLVLAIAG